MKIFTEETRKKISESIKKAHAEGRLSTSFGGRQGWSKGKKLPTRKRFVEIVLIENSPYSKAVAKQVILKNKLLDYVCAKCDIIEWFGKKLKLHLHHKNGISNDHRIENIDFLCPNCHDITPNHSVQLHRR
jgi:5-methylcytosine-specific restriction endonuclease McrA